MVSDRQQQSKNSIQIDEILIKNLYKIQLMLEVMKIDIDDLTLILMFRHDIQIDNLNY